MKLCRGRIQCSITFVIHECANQNAIKGSERYAKKKSAVAKLQLTLHKNLAKESETVTVCGQLTFRTK